MTHFSAICSDIDGTLLDARRELSERTIRIFRRLSPDVPVILASSRMPAAMRHLQAEMGIEDHPLICYNGGYVIRYKTPGKPEVFDSIAIPLDLCRTIVSLAAGTQIHVSLYFEDDWYVPEMDSWAAREARITKVNPVIRPSQEVFQRWERTGGGAHKIMCMGPAEEIAAMQAKLHEQVGNQIHVYLSRPTYLELAPGNVSKGSALDLVMQKVYGQSARQVIAFGDNYNDIDLLKRAGLGVAVANAREEVRQVAGLLAPASIDDGVAIVLENQFSHVD